MAKSKRKILLVNEFSQLSTGYSTYFKHILPYLHNSDKFELAELAVFLSPGHPKKDQWLSTTPWKVYMNEPPADAPAEIHAAYRSDQHNQLGKFRLDEVLLDFKPDILITMRDPYVDAFIDHTPYRKLFKHVHMPTIDSEPLKQEWIEQYSKADCLLTYSYFGKRVLEQQSGGKLKVSAVASPGAETREFFPMVKEDIREKLGIRKDAFIVQTVMRNQPRKLFPELFRAFAAFLSKCKEEGNNDLAARSYLHIHSTHPDLGWNLPVEIRNHKLSHKVIWTYMCESCQRHEVNFFRGPETVCPHCTKPSYHLPNTAMGLTRPALAEIMNLADVYIQYASCVPGETEIKTCYGGWKPIWEIKQGEFVQTHDGSYYPVIGTMKTNLGGRNMHEISFRGDIDKLQLTEEHPVLAWTKKNVCPNNGYSVREYLGAQLRLGKKLPDPQWVLASDLQNNDLAASLIDESVIDVNKIDLAFFAKENDIITEKEIKIFNGDTYPRFITIDEDFCRFVGLFAADGSATSDCTISCHKDEIANHSLCERVIEKITNKPAHTYHPSDAKQVDYRFNSRLIREVFFTWFQKGNKKQLPEWTALLPLDKQKALLHGLFMGDGFFSTDRQSGKYVTISTKLYQQIKNLLERQRINYSVRIQHNQDKWSQNRQPQYYFEMPGDIKHGEIVSKRNSSNSLYHKNFYFRKIKSNEIIKYDEPLFNLEVNENNSYVTRHAILHNCEGFGLPISDAKACGVPTIVTDYSALSEQGHSPGGIAIKPGGFGQEPYATSTGQIRVTHMDTDLLVNKLYELGAMPTEDLRKIGIEGRKLMEEVYDWEKIAKIWESVLEEVEIHDRNLTWYSAPQIVAGHIDLSSNNTNHEFVRECFTKILRVNPDANINEINRLVGILNQGYEMGHDQHGRTFRAPVNRQSLAQNMAEKVKIRNEAEHRRAMAVFGGIQRGNKIEVVTL